MSHTPDDHYTTGVKERGLLGKGWTDDAHYILADSSLTDGRIRVLKQGDTFAVFDHYGNIKPVKTGEEGVYHDGTRFVSSLLLELEGTPPFFLSSTVREDNDQLTVALTNPDLRCQNLDYLPLGSLHIARRMFLWQGVCYQEVRIENHSRQRVATSLRIRCAADYADIYEIRGMARKARGEIFPPSVEGSTVVWGYRGLDGVERRTHFEFSPAADVSANGAIFDLSLEPREVERVYVIARCERNGVPAPARVKFDDARAQAVDDIRIHKASTCTMYGSNGQFNAWVNRALSDLHMMTTALPTGPYPYAGVPWFNTPFGRDGLITAFECLWFWPDLARGVLRYLAQNQATSSIAEEDAEPGKILHETRNGEMAALKEMPYGRYYGAVDGTPLFVLLAGAYYDRTGDLRFIKDIWPNIQAALRWIEEFGDLDGDGFVEYQRRATDGLIHQGWKDADDAIFHEDGSEVTGPIALCEVQGYVYGAWQAAARLCEALGLHEQGLAPRNKAERLREDFNRAFWCEEISSFALALDGEKRPCRIRSSNAGQCLMSGIPTRAHARTVSQTLMMPRFFSGWGVRTVAEGEARYNPMGYHNGTVWPHDNALIAYGLGRYGFTKEVLGIFQGMFEAAMYFDLHRMPELFCGFSKEPGEGPVLYPVACSPQSWSAASIFLLLQSALGLQIDGVRRRLSLVRPALPSFLNDLAIANLRVGAATVDLHLTRHGDDVSLKVLRREGELEILTSQ
ncbi:MAG TPA: amylo-alpha-1,6-glucosidase [Bryobacteraceae bacterium]|nr:amylo-alpha-1,6-glucosidase [Bryobacteraceae bacterium]